MSENSQRDEYEIKNKKFQQCRKRTLLSHFLQPKRRKHYNCYDYNFLIIY